MELETASRACQAGGLTVPAISHVFTISYVAETLGEDEDWLHELSINMFPEDGCLRVYGVGEDGVPAFTEYGIECLKQIIADERAERRRPRCGRPGRLVRAGGKRRGLHAA
jgi:hypothetical protein